MDSIKSAMNSFGGGDNNNNNDEQGRRPQRGEYEQEGQYGRQEGGGMGGGRMSEEQGGQHQQKQGGGGGFLGGLGDKLNAAAGGGRESEKNEDYLDKGVDFVQEKFLGQGPQDNESAVEQAKDEKISDFIRDKYKSTTGNDFPVKDKPTTFDRNTD